MTKRSHLPGISDASLSLIARRRRQLPPRFVIPEPPLGVSAVVFVVDGRDRLELTSRTWPKA